jgi:SAM-dependent methyltransferase
VILDDDLWREFLIDCMAVGIRPFGPEGMALRASEAVRRHRDERGAKPTTIERRWYDSLERGQPDYDVYADDDYVADLWACWIVYSRRYLLALCRHADVNRLVGAARSVADLGCGLGYTTAALAEMSAPRAVVFGTNLPGLRQTAIAERVADRRGGFCVAAGVEGRGHVDLVFASEFFEHLPAPVNYLLDVLDELTPETLIVANTFTGRSTGHFDRYVVGGARLDGRATARAFGDALRRRGYRKLETGFWNGRPAVWIRWRNTLLP